MIKCLYNENCAENYPGCKSTCGMTMTELAFRKDEQLRELKQQMIQVRREYLLTIERAVSSARKLLEPEYYTPTCPCGCVDCVTDPAYIRDTHPEWWVELGMPIECDMYEVASDGEVYCCHYDDEDK